MRDVRDQLMEIYGLKANNRYGLSAVNQLQHGLQAAMFAEDAGENAAFITAALLHDIGHMVHDLGEDPATEGVDDLHEARGADWLEQHFGPAVVAPIRLHVAAKRYLCAVEPDYFGQLSDDSIRSLALQGGPMSVEEVAGFARLPYHAEAIRLRRLDEAAKVLNLRTPDFQHFLKYIERALADAPPSDRGR